MAAPPFARLRHLPWAPALLLALLTACSSGNAGNPVAAGHTEFDQGRAWAHLEEIVAIGPRPSGSAANAELRDLLVRELAGLGLEPVREPFTEDTPVGPLEFENVYADLPGGGEDPPIVVLCTHFDTKRFTQFEFVGANDGGSGTAVLLELARVLASESEPREVTYRLLFLDGEESVNASWVDPDNRYGSRYHVAQLEARPQLLARVRACVLLDLVGDADLVLIRESYSNQEILLEDFFGAVKGSELERHVWGPKQPINDDHQSFLAAGIPSINLIDARYGPYTRTGLGAWWHKAEDTLDKCSAESLGAVGRIVLLGLPRLEARVLR